MHLYLLQHAEAFSSEQYKDRPLTEQGYLDAMKVADCIRLLSLPVEAVWHSGKTRALQTAKIFHAAVRTSADLEVRPGLLPNDDPRPVAADIQKFQKDLLIVGHLPFLSHLAGLLLTGNPEVQPVAFQKAALVCLHRSEPGTWQLQWMLTPSLL